MYVTANNISPMHVLLVEDHGVLRDGLQMLIDAQQDFKVVGVAATAGEALQVASRVRIDVAVLDLQLPDRSGIHVARDLRKEDPEVRVLILTAYHTPQYVRAAQRAGVRGFLPKEASGPRVVAAVRAVARGGTVFDLAVGAPARNNPCRDDLPESLSGRELEVLRLMATGARNETIAHELDISPRTVEVHVSAILTKLGVVSRVEAVMAGIQLGFVSL